MEDRRLVILLIVAILLVAPFTGCLKHEDNDGNGDDNPVPPKAKVKVDKEDIFENETIAFSAEDSIGDIEEYHWEFGDGAESSGETATHTYDEVGEYRVRLTVIDKRGDAHTDVHFIHVHHIDKYTEKITISQKRTHAIPVEDMAEGIKVTLRYPTGSVIVGQPSNDLDLQLYYPNGTLYMSSEGQKPDEGTEQTEWLNVPKQELMASFFGNWRAEVTADTGIEVELDLEIIVSY